MGGGAGSRLGFNGPKGAFSIGLPSGATLFGLAARRIAAAEAEATVWALEHRVRLPAGGLRVPWFVMTSSSNDAATRRHFAAHDNFGLMSEQVHFFEQSSMPALSAEGRLLMAGRV